MMNYLKLIAPLLVCVQLSAGVTQKFDGAFDKVSDAMIFSAGNGTMQLELGFESDVTFFYKDTGIMAWAFPRDNTDRDILSARQTFTTDVYFGNWFYVFGKYRIDDGFHPGLQKMKTGKSVDVRTDELFLMMTPPDVPFTVKAGRIAPSFGNFIGRHGPWESSFIIEPMVYNQFTSVTDGAVPGSAAAFAGRRNAADVASWVPVIWGPLYNQGIEIAGFTEKVGVSFTYMNSSVSSRPEEWNDSFDDPSYAARLTYAPSAKWNYGASASVGPYLRDRATGLPTGKTVDDYWQYIFGADLKFSYRNWQVYAEMYFNRFEVPNMADDADSFSYYVEGKYKINPRWFLAARWNQQLYSKVNVPGAGKQNYDNAIYRIDLGVGAKWTRHLMSKAQYSYQHQATSFQNGEHLLGLQTSLKF